MKAADKVTGGAFLALGLALVASGLGLPAGVGGQPGAGFFPQAIGGLMAVLACGLLLKRGEDSADESFGISNAGQVAGTAALLLGYLLLWGTGFFVVRTAVFLALALRFLGQGWLPSAAYGVAMSSVVYLAFSIGLNVSLE